MTKINCSEVKKLDCHGAKELKREEYEKYKLKIKPAWDKFEKVRKPFYENFVDGKEPFHKAHDRIVAPAWEKYEKEIEKPLKEYNLFCDALNGLLKHRGLIKYRNNTDLKQTIKEEILRLKTEEKKKEVEEAKLKKWREKNLITFKQK